MTSIFTKFPLSLSTQQLEVKGNLCHDLYYSACSHALPKNLSCEDALLSTKLLYTTPTQACCPRMESLKKFSSTVYTCTSVGHNFCNPQGHLLGCMPTYEF